MKLLRLFIIFYCATCLPLYAADTPQTKGFIIATATANGVHTTFLTPATERALPSQDEWPSVWVSSNRRICIPSKFFITDTTTSADNNAMKIVFPKMAADDENYSLYEQAMEDAIISLLVWSHETTLYYNKKWMETAPSQHYVPIIEVLPLAGRFLYKKDVVDERSRIAERLIAAYDSHLPQVLQAGDDGHFRLLEKFINPEEPNDTPRCFLLLCAEQLKQSQHDPTLLPLALRMLWNGVCQDISGAPHLFIKWIYNHYSTPSDSTAEAAEETKNETNDEQTLLVPIFDHDYYMVLYRALEHCAISILDLPRRGMTTKPDQSEPTWTTSLSCTAREFYKEKKYEKAAALYAFIESFSQDKFLYKHLVAFASIFRYQVGNHAEASRCFKEAINRGYPCHTPLAHYLARHDINIKADDDSCCSSCAIL